MKFPSLQPSLANLAGVKSKSYRVSVKAAEGDSGAEILIHGPIGRSFWADDGITGKEFTDALNKFPAGTKITVGINSQGGEVGEGLAIYNAIARRSGDITCRIDGYAISIASVIPLAAGKVISPASSIWMIHNAWSWFSGGQGNAEDMRQLAKLADKAAEMLDKHDDVIVASYVSSSTLRAAAAPKSEKEFLDAMAEETWLTGAEAVEWGLADEASENEADLEALDFSGMEAKTFKRIPLNCRAMILAAGHPKLSQAPQGTDQNQNQIVMNRNQMLALLKSWGVETKDSMTDEQIVALVGAGKPQAAATTSAANVIHLTASDVDKAVTSAVQAAEKRAEVKTTLAQLVTERRITQAQADKWLPTALKDDSVLAALKENPVMPVAAEALAPESEISVEASPRETALAIARFDEPLKAWQRGNDSITPEQIQNASRDRAQFIEKHSKKIIPVMNTNTVPAGLKRSVILQTLVQDFARKVLRLDAFALKIDNVKLLGDNKVQVPYYDLDSSASTSFVSGTGYTTIGNTTTAVKEITVGEGATDGDRLFQALSFSSQEFARQPFLNIMQLAKLKAQKLASDIVTDVLGIITVANFPTTAKTEDADSFDSDDVIDIKLACKLWDEDGRFLYLDSAYDANLLKDPSFKAAYAAASDRAIKEGKLNPRVFSFDYVENPTIPENGEKLVGFATFKGAAIGVAFAPVPPVDEVRNAGTTYEIYTDPVSGLMLEYRTFGNNTTDAATHVIESSYGFAKLNAGALKAVRRP